MNDIFSTLERLFGSRVLVAALLVVLIYAVAQALLKIASLLTERVALQSQLNALKTHFEIQKLAYEIEALRLAARVEQAAEEVRLAELSRRLVSRHSEPDALVKVRTALVTELSRLAGRRWVGHVLYLFAHLVLRLWGAGLVSYFVIAAIFGDDSTKQGAHWDNIIIISVLIICGFFLSSLIIVSTKSAGIPDRLRYWTYVAGFLVACFLVWVGSIT